MSQNWRAYLLGTLKKLNTKKKKGVTKEVTSHEWSKSLFRQATGLESVV